MQQTDASQTRLTGGEYGKLLQFLVLPCPDPEHGVPDVAFSILDAYRYISEPIAKERTEQLRGMTSHDEARLFKARHFDYCTFSGLFKSRSSSQLIQHSGLVCVDFDHVEDIPALKQQLLEHEYFDTILMFTSAFGKRSEMDC